MLLWLVLLVGLVAVVLYRLQHSQRLKNARARLNVPPQGSHLRICPISRCGLVVSLPECRIHLDSAITKVASEPGCAHVSQDAPTVVLCGGLIPGVITWKAVQTEVQKFASVVSIDRPGFGWSSTCSNLTADKMVDLLYATLKSQSVPSPYVLVGHCVAGIEISLFASKYPKEVSGLVFVDAFTPSHFSPECGLLFYSIALSRLPSFVRHPPNSSLRDYVKQLLGTHSYPPLFYMRHNADTEAALACHLVDPTGEEAAQAYAMTLPRSIEQLNAVGNKKLEVPCAAVISLPYNDLFFGLPNRTQAEEAWERGMVSQCLSNTSTVIYAVNGNHFPQMSQPKMVVDAIKAVIDKSKSAPKSSTPSLEKSSSGIHM